MKFELTDDQIEQIAQRVAALVSKKSVAKSGLLTISEVARILNKCDMTVRRLMRRDRLFPSGILLGGEYRFNADEINKYLNIKQSEYRKRFLRS